VRSLGTSSNQFSSASRTGNVPVLVAASIFSDLVQAHVVQSSSALQQLGWRRRRRGCEHCPMRKIRHLGIVKSMAGRTVVNPIFVPFAIESYGGWGDEGLEFFRALKAFALTRTSTSHQTSLIYSTNQKSGEREGCCLRMILFLK